MISSLTWASIRGQVNRGKKPRIEGKHEVERLGLYSLDVYTLEYLVLLISFCTCRNNQEKKN